MAKGQFYAKEVVRGRRIRTHRDRNPPKPAGTQAARNNVTGLLVRLARRYVLLNSSESASRPAAGAGNARQAETLQIAQAMQVVQLAEQTYTDV